MTKLHKLKKAIHSPKYIGRQDDIRHAFDEYEQAITWWHPLMEVLGCQAVIMVGTLAIYA